MISNASNSTSFNAGVIREALGARDAYLEKLNRNQTIAQNQNNKVLNTGAQLNTPVSMQGVGQKLNVIA